MSEHAADNRVNIAVDQIDNVYICNYKARDLMVLALMLGDDGVTPTDLNEYVRNIEHVYTKLEQDFNERVLKLTKTYDGVKGEF